MPCTATRTPEQDALRQRAWDRYRQDPDFRARCDSAAEVALPRSASSMVTALVAAGVALLTSEEATGDDGWVQPRPDETLEQFLDRADGWT